MEINPDIIELLKEFKRTKVWRGSIDERKQKFMACHGNLNQLYGRNIKLVFKEVTPENERISCISGLSAYSEEFDTMVLFGKLSVITFIQLWGRAIGITPVDSIQWSKEIFDRVFPVSSRNIVTINGLMVKTNDVDNDPSNDPVVNDGGN